MCGRRLTPRRSLSPPGQKPGLVSADRCCRSCRSAGGTQRRCYRPRVRRDQCHGGWAGFNAMLAAGMLREAAAITTQVDGQTGDSVRQARLRCHGAASAGPLGAEHSAVHRFVCLRGGLPAGKPFAASDRLTISMVYLPSFALARRGAMEYHQSCAVNGGTRGYGREATPLPGSLTASRSKQPKLTARTAKMPANR